MVDIHPGLLTAGMFSFILMLMAAGIPLVWALMAIGMAAAYVFWGSSGVLLLVSTAFDTMDNFLLVSLPLFIFMGLVLQRSGITDQLFDLIGRQIGMVPGGLGMGTIVICSIIAAMAGVSGAATVSLGLIALPAMLRYGYDSRLATGAIMAGGALGFLIPPSVVMIVYAFLARESVGKLFAAGLVPGLMLALIYIAYIGILCRLRPRLGPPVSVDRSAPIDRMLMIRALVLPGLLIFLVLGLIISGVTSPSEGAAVGAAGALVCSVIYGQFSFRMLTEALYQTAKLMGMMIWIMIAAIFFSKVFVGLGAGAFVAELFMETGLGPYGIIVSMLVCFFVLGMFLDDFAIMFITIPIFVPIVRSLGFDPVWFATLFVLCMQTAYLTPPFGYNLIYMRSVAPPQVTMMDLYKGAAPFVALQILGVILVLIFPSIALWLPRVLFE